MVTELSCRDVIACLHGATSNLEDKTISNALPKNDLYRELFGRYPLSVIDETIRWLEFGNFIYKTGAVKSFLSDNFLYALKDKGVELATSHIIPEEDRKILYTEDPYSVFVARQFREQDDSLFAALSEALINTGYSVLDGRVDGLDAFRGEILSKIRGARLFLCLLTQREELKRGGFASSVWLYQETGAAVALGKKPLLLVEDGMHDHYAGELQKNYEYITFTRTHYADVLPEVLRRIGGDLSAYHIPLPVPKSG